MALAEYFAKTGLSAATLLHGFDLSDFANQLESHTPAILFDESAATSREGRTTLTLATNLLSRLYPRLLISGIGSASADVERVACELRRDALAVNDQIELVDNWPSREAGAALVVGDTRNTSPHPAIYVGSSGWTVKTSSAAPVSSGRSDLPFAAAAAACFGAAAIFRMFFRHQLPGSSGPAGEDEPDCVQTLADAPMLLNLLTMGTAECEAHGESVTGVADLGDTTIVGLGAIGNAVVWTLARTPALSGRLNLVDGEEIEVGNLQRYVLAQLSDVSRTKVERAAEYLDDLSHLTGSHGSLTVVPIKSSWGEYAASTGDYRFDRVLVCLDSAEARLQVQASLPRWVLNAWTQPENCGVSRHGNFGIEPCLGCLYMPVAQRKSQDVLVAEAVRATGDSELMEIRTRLHDGRPVGEQFVRRVAERFNVEADTLLKFAERPLAEFYVRALCGGMILNLGGGHDVARQVEVPMAFQSALAGVLLAAELVIDVCRLRGEPLPCRTEIDLLRPVGAFINIPTARLATGRCMCQDDAFVRAYRRKYTGSTN